MASDDYSELIDDPPRMWIDLIPPDYPEKGDVWIRLGEWRTWNGGWDPPFTPELKRGRRRGRTMKIQVERESGELYEEWLRTKGLSDSPKE